ncbi:type 2 lactosamine alpha-2,3-sialyltransferase-like isoform X3 [Heptranchias perlo]|uniref:type 2 lactosamine alpha-2,3-sialyltransferase-like isoform X3 n=1 Tax=Heptranchias perlo TaxID=212740 RepID=UPI00355AC97B
MPSGGDFAPSAGRAIKQQTCGNGGRKQITESCLAFLYRHRSSLTWLPLLPAPRVQMTQSRKIAGSTPLTCTMHLQYVTHIKCPVGGQRGLGSMKRRRCLKLLVLVLLLFFYYLFYDKMKASGSKHKNPFLCSSDIDYKRWPANAMTVPEILPFGTLSSERYFQAVLSELKSCDVPEKLKNLSCLNCIVVGNGGVLRNKTLGKKIDSYDVVIRLNSGPVIGYEDDVGNKTTFRFCYPESLSSDRSQYDADTTLVFVPFKAVDLRWLKEMLLKRRVSMRGFWKKTPKELIYKNSQIRILKPSIVQKAAFDLLNLSKVVPWPKPPQYPTTGIIAISMALTMCDKVHVAGFKYEVSSPNSTLHYYGNDTMSAMRKMVYHNVSAEQMLLKKLKSSSTIFDLTGKF